MPPTGPVKGVPPGLLAAIEGRLKGRKEPVRRRALLEELERAGHRVSLAGLNRALQALREAGVTVEGDDGVRWAAP